MNSFVKSVITGGLTLTSLAAFGAISYAQEDTIPVQKPFRVKIGGSFGGGQVKADLGAIGSFELLKIDYRLNGGVAYDFTKTTATNPVIFNVYADYFTGSEERSFSAGGQNFSFDTESTTIAIGVGARYLFAPAIGTKGQPYGEFGLGYYSTKLDIDGDNETEGGLGGKIALGYQLSMGAFGEIEYTVIDKFSKEGVTYEPSSIRASIGYRF